MKNMKRVLIFIMTFAMVLTSIASTAEAATKAKLNKKKATLTITDNKKKPTITLKMKGVSNKVAKKAKWSTSNKKIATVKKGKVTAKRAGKATITCKVMSKKYTCKVTVIDNTTSDNDMSDDDMSDNDMSDDNVSVNSTLIDITIKSASTNNGVNQVVVTYDGKDVTNVAEYASNQPAIGYADKNGVINFGGYGGTFKLTVSYVGAKKTVEIGKKSIKKYYNECYCGEKFYDDDDGAKISEHAETNMRTGNPGHDGHYIVPYYTYDAVKVE